MERRNIIKSLVAFEIFALLPKISLNEKSENKRLHFVGIGNGGTSAMMHIHAKGIEAKYTCITGSFVALITPDVKHLFYVTPKEYRDYNSTQGIELTREMMDIFEENDHFIVLTGLGGFSGTGLISNILKHLQNNSKSYHAICSLPFEEEGSLRVKYACMKKVDLEKDKNVIIFDQNPLGNHNIAKELDRGYEIYYQILKTKINLV